MILLLCDIDKIDIILTKIISLKTLKFDQNRYFKNKN